MGHYAGEMDGSPGPNHKVPSDLATENERLRAALKLHAGDTMSLSNELDEWRARALAAEEALALTNGEQ